MIKAPERSGTVSMTRRRIGRTLAGLLGALVALIALLVMNSSVAASVAGGVVSHGSSTSGQHIAAAEPTGTATAQEPTSTPTACTLTFTDVPAGSTFYSYAHCLGCLGIINGYSDGSFKPGNNVTRAQLSKIVANSAGLSVIQTARMFQDVPVGSTFYQYIGRLASRGYINGYYCGGPGEPCVPPTNLPYFRPNNNATRGQISKIVSNAAAFNDTPSGQQQFQDVPVGSTYYAFIYRLASRQAMSGYQCGAAPAGPCVAASHLPYFMLNNNATRGQTSKIDANTFFPDCQILDRSTR